MYVTKLFNEPYRYIELSWSSQQFHDKHFIPNLFAKYTHKLQVLFFILERNNVKVPELIYLTRLWLLLIRAGQNDGEDEKEYEQNHQNQYYYY